MNQWLESRLVYGQMAEQEDVVMPEAKRFKIIVL
jgi:hypothetical protein